MIIANTHVYDSFTHSAFFALFPSSLSKGSEFDGVLGIFTFCLVS